MDIHEFWNRDFDRYWETRARPPESVTARLRVIETNPYRIPFDDATFDFVSSSQVFEHVHDYVEAFREIGRVLKPGGVSLHQFPARWKPIEAHVQVPFASVFRSRAYLAAWAIAGIRNVAQQGKGWREVVSENREALRTGVNYPTARTIHRWAHEAGVDVSFVPDLYVRHHPGRAGKLLRQLRIPGAAAVFCTFAQRPMVVRRSHAARPE